MPILTSILFLNGDKNSAETTNKNLDNISKTLLGVILYKKIIIMIFAFEFEIIN